MYEERLSAAPFARPRPEASTPKRVAALVAAVSILGAACPSNSARKPQFSASIATTHPDAELDAGHITIHASVARSVPFGAERLTLSQLADAGKVFAMLQGSRQSDRGQSTFGALSAGLSISPPLLDSVTTKETGSQSLKDTATGADSTSINAEGKTLTSSSTGSGSEGNAGSTSERTTTSNRPDIPGAPSGALSLPTGYTATTATPYELFYATAETVLAARSLENLYNVADGPDGWILFSIPVIASFDPGRVTRRNYTAESVLSFSIPKQQNCALVDFRLVAVAPAGLSSFASSSMSELSRLQASLGAGAPLGAAAAQLEIGSVREALDTFASMARRPDLQISISGPDSLSIRYLGRETFERGVELSPLSFNLELLALIKITPPPPDAVCNTEGKIDRSSQAWRQTSQLVLAGERRPAIANANELKLEVDSRFRPAFSAPEGAAQASIPARVHSSPSYSNKSEPSTQSSLIIVYSPPKQTRIDGAFYSPDGRILLTGLFADSSCTCFELFAGAQTAPTQMTANCRWVNSGSPPSTLLFDVAPGKHPPAEEQKQLAGRISLLSVRDPNKCKLTTLASGAPDEVQRVAGLPVKLLNPPPAPTPASGTASFRTISAVLDDSGASFFVQFDGDATAPLVLVDGQAVASTRIEFDKPPQGKKSSQSGRLWLRVPGNHDYRLMKKTYLLSIGAGAETKETQAVVASR